jgi:hypothetical protein
MPSGVEKLSFDVEELSSLAVTENGRNRSNSRQLSEILFFVKLKHQRER